MARPTDEGVVRVGLARLRWQAGARASLANRCASVREMDGHKQRQALTAAERSIAHLVAGKPEEAERAAQRADELDQIGIFSNLIPAVGAAAADVRDGGRVQTDHVEELLAAVGAGPLAELVQRLR